MGMGGVARTLSAFPEIGCFAVANVSEGVTLRREGIRQDILIMGSTLPFQYAPAVECDLTVTVSRLGMVPELAEVCKAQSKPLNVQIKLETGMHRIGVEPGEELAALSRGARRRRRSGSMSTGAFSHFAWPGNAESARRSIRTLRSPARSSSKAGRVRSRSRVVDHTRRRRRVRTVPYRFFPRTYAVVRPYATSRVVYVVDAKNERTTRRAVGRVERPTGWWRRASWASVAG